MEALKFIAAVILSAIFVGTVILAVKLEDVYPVYLKIILAAGFVAFQTWIIYGFLKGE